MTNDIETIISLRRVLESAGRGMGISQALLDEFIGNKGGGGMVAQLVLLGYPLRESLRPFLGDGTGEVSMLSSLIVSVPRSSANLVGKSGAVLASTLESWIRAKEGRQLEQKVMRFRGLVASGVLGAVSAMMSSLGPIVGSLNFLANSAQVPGGSLLPWAAGVAAMSSGMLGLYLSGRGFVFNVVVTVTTFLLVATAVSPLANVPLVNPWGVK